MNRRWGLLVLATVCMFGCRGEELARVKLQKPGDTGETKWTVAGNRKAQVWAEYNGKWSGKKHPGVVYDVELLDGEKSIQKLECSSDSCSSTVCGSTVNVNNNYSGDCECKTSCSLEAPADGTYTVRATVKGPGSMHEFNSLSIILRK